MAASGKLSKKELKKLPQSKASLASPFSPTWSPLPQEDMHFILETLKDKLASVGLEKKEAKVFRPWRKKKKEQKTDDAVAAAATAAAATAAAATTAPVTPTQEPPKNGWTDVAVRRQLAIGINEVTKALERNELRLVLVCKSVKPNHMTSHLIALSATRGVPACQVPRLSQSVSEPLGLKSVLALGFRRCAAAAGEQVFTDTVDMIKPRVPALKVAWLPAEVTTNKPTNLEEEEEEEERKKEEEGKEANESRGQKRKLERESPSSVSLQPLEVKRIVANPARKKKKKTKVKAKGKTA